MTMMVLVVFLVQAEVGAPMDSTATSQTLASLKISER